MIETPDVGLVDAILTEAERAEGRTMMICCSGSLSERLVLDL